MRAVAVAQAAQRPGEQACRAYQEHGAEHRAGAVQEPQFPAGTAERQYPGPGAHQPQATIRSATVLADSPVHGEKFAGRFRAEGTSRRSPATRAVQVPGFAGDAAQNDAAEFAQQRSDAPSSAPSAQR